MILQPSAFDLQLEKLTYDVMGRLEDGRAVFVPFGRERRVVNPILVWNPRCA